MLSVVVAPGSAQAATAPYLGLRASDTTVETGEQVKLSGRAVRLPVGRRVKVQRSTGDGTWSTLQTTRVRGDHTWRAVTTPRVGAQRYRVRAYHRTGPVISRTLRVVATSPAPPPPPSPSTPTVTLTWSHQLLRVAGAEGAYWHNDLSGMVTDSAGEVAVLQKFDGGTWVPTGRTETVGDDGSYRFFFLDWQLRNVQLRVCVGATETHTEGCSAPIQTDDSDFVADVDLHSITSTIREESSPDGTVTHYQEAVLTGSTDLPAGVSIGAQYRIPGQDEWLALDGGLLPNTGEFTLTVRTPPDATEVRLGVSNWGDVARSFSEQVLPYELKPFHVDLDDPPLRIENIPVGRGALVKFDAEAGQVFHAIAYEGGNILLNEWVEGPDGTRVEETPLDTGSYRSTWYFRAETAGQHTFVISSAQQWQWAGAVPDLFTPTRVNGPAHHSTFMSTERHYQVAEYHFTGAAGQVVTLPRNNGSNDCASVDLLAAGDYENRLPRLFGPPWEIPMIWKLPADGEYFYRITPCQGHTVSYLLQSPAPTEQHLEVTNDIQEFTLPPGGWAKLTFEARAGDHIRIEMTNHPSRELGSPDYWAFDGIGARQLTAPDGTELPLDFEAPQTGTYTLWAEQGTYSAPATSTWRVLLREVHP